MARAEVGSLLSLAAREGSLVIVLRTALEEETSGLQLRRTFILNAPSEG
jgi:hypothetical protein